MEGTMVPDSGFYTTWPLLVFWGLVIVGLLVAERKAR